MPTIASNGVNLYYEVSGQGDPLLLIAGLACDHTLFDSMVPYLSTKYQVIAFDNRVHCRLKVRNCRLRVLERPHLLGKLRPASKSMLARQKELRISQQRRHSAILLP